MGMTDGDSYSRLSVFNPIHCRNKALSGLFNAYRESSLVRRSGIYIVDPDPRRHRLATFAHRILAMTGPIHRRLLGKRID
jgi:hypothetical protein